MRVKIVSENNLIRKQNNKEPIGIYDDISVNLINSIQKILMGSFALYDAINARAKFIAIQRVTVSCHNIKNNGLVPTSSSRTSL